MKTAIEQCIDKIKERQSQCDGKPNAYSELQFVLDILTELLSVEKGQILNAFNAGSDNASCDGDGCKVAADSWDFDNYFTETYAIK